MERIHYAGGSVLTGSAIARALLEYAEALAEEDESATVDVPGRHDDGSVGRSNLLIGPASQLISETEDSTFDELVDEDLVIDITEKTRQLRHTPVAGPLEASSTETGAEPDWETEYPTI